LRGSDIASDIANRPTDLPLEQRLRGLLLGGAVGDALGAPVEFMSRAEILRAFGPKGIRSFAPAYGRIGAITDDTQMTLFTLEGLIRGYVRWDRKGIANPACTIDHAYRRWYATQAGGDENRQWDGWLITQETLWARRAPGNTCLSALAAKGQTFGEAACNDSKGAGGIMRVAPIGLLMRGSFETGCDVAGLTHGHVTGKVAAGWLSRWVFNIGAGSSPYDGAVQAMSLCERAPEVHSALQQAFKLAAAGPAEAVPKALGEGWIAEEAAAITLWCVLTADDPFDAVCKAVNIDGDSDTTGSLVGQVMGALLGEDWIPTSLLDQLELRDVMTELASDAVRIMRGPDADGDWAWKRYPGW